MSVWLSTFLLHTVHAPDDEGGQGVKSTDKTVESDMKMVCQVHNLHRQIDPLFVQTQDRTSLKTCDFLDLAPSGRRCSFANRLFSAKPQGADVGFALLFSCRGSMDILCSVEFAVRSQATQQFSMDDLQAIVSPEKKRK